MVPLTQDTAYLFKVGPEPGNPHHADDQLHELLRARLAVFGRLIGEIRDRHINDPAQVVYRPLEAFLLPNPWYRGRVLLIGTPSIPRRHNWGKERRRPSRMPWFWPNCLASMHRCPNFSMRS